MATHNKPVDNVWIIQRNQHVIASGNLVQLLFTMSPVEYEHNCLEAVLDVR